MAPMSKADRKKGSVYVSWATFKNAVDSLSQGVPPNKLDRSVFPGIAWAIQNQLFAGLKFLDLMDADHRPTKKLESLAIPDESERKLRLAEILRDRYADLFALDLQKATPGELEQKMGESYQVSGDTRDKAVRFFLSAAEYAGIKLSPYFSGKKAGTKAVSRKAKARKQKDLGVAEPAETPRPVSTGTSKVIQLRSGGTLVFSASIDLFALTSSDRQFVFGLIDDLDRYEQNSGRTETPASAGTLNGRNTKPGGQPSNEAALV